MQPLYTPFNVAARQIANRLFPTGYDVAVEAPNTLPELNAHITRTGRMLVWSGASDATIFACPETNWAFRAWHDWCHWRGQFAFDPEGERLACAMQREHVRQLYGRGVDADVFCALLDAEVNGQIGYHATTGDFPADQRVFVLDYLAQHHPDAYRVVSGQPLRIAA